MTRRRGAARVLEEVLGILRGLHAASSRPDAPFFLVTASFGRYVGMWPIDVVVRR
jgi:hypothetical protein